MRVRFIRAGHIRGQLHKFAQLIAPHRFKRDYIQAEIDRLNAVLYLEIGVRDGATFRGVRCRRKIAVDPVRTEKMQLTWPGEGFFEETSDDFFSNSVGDALAGESIDVALVDGLHEFEQVIRDVMNCAHWMRPDGVIVLDDCNPSSAERGQPVPTGGPWNGDVWKAVALIRRTQPQWQCVTFDTDQGIGLIWGFESGAAAISEDDLAWARNLRYEDLEKDRSIIGLVPALSRRELTSH